MTAPLPTATVPDAEVDESELTQQPCTTEWRLSRLGWASRWHVCGRPSVGEDMVVCSAGHERVFPHCGQHLGLTTPPPGNWSCSAKGCCAPVHLVVSRYYRTPR